jgi:iron complex outermembrane recepter protein
MMRIRKQFTLAASALILISSQGAIAETTPAKQARDTSARRARPVGIEQLTVTARKREERMQDTPLAVTAISGPELQDLDVRRLHEITSQVPNLAFDQTSENSQAARLYLRGVGNGDGILSDDPGVGIYLDGVYLARAQSGLLTVSDIQRVEVLRGPQGTLFGKNTIGGTVNVITRKPTLDEFGGSAEVRLGNYDRFDSRLSLNIPLVAESTAARFSIATATRDGFQKNKGVGPDLDDDKVLALRTQLLTLPSDDFELMLSLDHSIENRKPQGYKCKVSNPFPVGQNAQTRPDLAATGTEFRAAPLVAIFAQQLGAANLNQAGLNLLTQTNPFLAACAEDQKRDERSVNSELSFQKEYLKTFGTSATFTWSASDNLTLKWISAWRRQQIDQARDFDATGFRFATLDVVDAGDEQQDQLSHELQLTGVAIGGRLSYVGGLYAFSEKNTDTGYQGFTSGQVFLFPPNLANPTFLLPTPSTFEATRLQVNNRGYAAYGQGTYSLTDRLGLTLGLRLTSERKRARRDVVCQGVGLTTSGLCLAAGQQLFGFEGSTRPKDISPLATLKYELSDEAQLYATWTRGFKSGGFNGRATTLQQTRPVDDENLTSYEVGFKSLFADSRLRLNGAVFYNVYQDIQLSIPQPNGTLVVNAGRAEIHGAELEMRAIALPGLELSSALGVTHGRYTEFDHAADPSDPAIPEDPKDRALLGTPAYTMNFGASYQFPIGALGDLRARTDWTHTGRSGTDVVDSRILRKSKHGELDAQLAWMMPDGLTEVVLFGNNLLDREYIVNGLDFGPSFGHAALLYNAPRTYGVELRRSF